MVTIARAFGRPEFIVTPARLDTGERAR
jgi:hypothetical protein